MTSFPKADWIFLPYDEETLTEEEEELPAHMPKPLGPSMTMRVFVDSDHAGDMLTCCLLTGFIVFFLNNAPIYLSSKKQNSC